MLVKFERNGIQYEKHGAKYFCWPVGFKGQRRQIKKAEYVAALEIVKYANQFGCEVIK